MQVSPVRVWVLALIIENDIISTINACGRGSVVERLLAKEKATGSNPVARSKNPAGIKPAGFVYGDVAKW